MGVIRFNAGMDGGLTGLRGPRAAALAAGGTIGIVALAAAAAATAPRLTPLLFLGFVTVAIAAVVAYYAWTIDAAVVFAGAFVIAIFASNWPAMGVPGALSPQRILLLIAVVVVLLGAPSVAGRRPRLHPVHVILGVALLYAAISAAVAENLFDRGAFFELFDNFGMLPFLVFLIAPVLFADARSRNYLLAGFVGLGLYLGFTALMETVGVRALVFPSYINDPDVGIHFDRARGPFVEAATNGLAMFTCAVGAVLAWSSWRSRLGQGLALAAMVLCTAGVLFTLTRQAWLAAVLATIVTLVVVRDLRRFLVPVLVGGAIIVGGALLAFPALSERTEERAVNQGTVWERLNNNRAAVAMFLERPLLGFGWNSYLDEKADFVKQADDYPITGGERRTGVHNLGLLYAAELGMLGVALWVSGFLLAIGGAISRRGSPELRPWRLALIPVSIAFMVVATFEYPGVFSSLTVWLWAGVAWGLDDPAEGA
jgi:O-antigen ligase